MNGPRARTIRAVHEQLAVFTDPPLPARIDGRRAVRIRGRVFKPYVTTDGVSWTPRPAWRVP